MGLHWKKMMTATVTAAVLLQAGFLGVSAQETEIRNLQELTAQELETEEGSAASAYMTIGDSLYYGNYGIGRTDVPATAAYFYITTKDEEGNIINDGRFAYCVQSYFLTPLGGDYTEEMTDNVASIGGGKNLQKVVYYGYGGAGYDAEEFAAFLKETDADYYETVFEKLDEDEKKELSYILTHGAASYAYFKDGTSFGEYLKLQFQVRYGDDWEQILDAFVEQDVERSGITDGDLDLFGATYGMNFRGITLTKEWYQLLTSKKDPALGVVMEEHVYTFQGNEKNEELQLVFEVPEDFACTINRENGEVETVSEGTAVTVYPAESFTFTYQEELSSAEKDGITSEAAVVEGTLSGTENEEWNLILLETNKGTNVTVSRRQQDIAATTAVNMGRTDLEFAVEMQKGTIAVNLLDNAGKAVADVKFGVYYDMECTEPVQMDGEAVEITSDSDGQAYLEVAVNQTLEENGRKLYIRETEVPTGYLSDGFVYCMELDESIKITYSRETVSISGTVEWKVPEGTELPEEVTLDLYQDGELLDSTEISEENGWTYRFEGLEKYSEDGSKAYTYTVDVGAVEGYTFDVKDGQVTGIYEPETEPATEETETETPTETETETPTETETEMPTETETETPTETESEMETEVISEEEQNANLVRLWVIVFAIAAGIVIYVIKRTKNNR